MILIVGGAGYIGSHTNKALNEAGYETVVLDNLSYGHEESIKWGEFCKCDLANIDDVDEVFNKYDITAVMHFSSFIDVGESVTNPEKYYTNNVVNTMNLLHVMLKHNVKKFIFSSTCATYGVPQKIPLVEDHPQNPINPYGMTKLMVEKILKDYDNAYGLKSVILRYFNASGADESGEIGEWHNPETHLIPLILDAAIGKREDIKIFGTDYDTEDGTCIRDYIHVTDLADAHIRALKYLEDENTSNEFNLGNGVGFSVRQVIESAKKVTGRDFKVEETKRRPGDPAVLIGSSKKAKDTLGWNPQYTDIDDIIKTAWIWHQKLNK
ncbi:MAG: UDP-glucose 4-epimerase GalE [Methanosphaera sp.]|uniref:UDP-glucose 4-epimerase GalE n=1 Tax=Methanosphaera sp. TaxID=2666342 RepID=UPI0025F3329A|nr:UDP-glucose 4-epimerase GalE [Methanosphaera sp.]MCI5867173.1 UDP-glucose 4-epimerase GalE [Methanosphaera sp.]MDD6534759.1 UDP-glucose 4-epimerase GalE [Methanosphaera sp.]MDY3955573.1 UDP-glucose 4-epimerase GalE [Methanosphaera sp.]